MPPNSLRLLSLDGGGIRGLSSLMILQRLMARVNPDNPPKPCQFFDMIGGTSTGGMSVDECIEAYLTLSKGVFEKSTSRLRLNGQLKGRFDAKNLERAIKETIALNGLPEDTLLADHSESSCKVFVCATSAQMSKVVCLTTYKSFSADDDLLERVQIWEACRATSAASTFFEPISLGPYGERFVDGATGANNPVDQLWDQAREVWGSEAFEDRVQVLVSIGTGVPSIQPFESHVLGILPTLVAISTETEETARRFQKDKSSLDGSGRYFRFNVEQGLQDIGLEEWKRKDDVSAATRNYFKSVEMGHKIKSFVDTASGTPNIVKYDLDFSLSELPATPKFVDRTTDMICLAEYLRPGTFDHKRWRQVVFVLHGLGGIGKTSLAAEFARQHHEHFSAVLWLDGSSRDKLRRSLARQWGRIRGRTRGSESASVQLPGEEVDFDIAVQNLRNWLAAKDNKRWLLIIDNVDRVYNDGNSDEQAYRVEEFLPDADHGFILITSRLARLADKFEFGKALQRVDRRIATEIFNKQCQRRRDETDFDRLLDKLDGLPLAIVQAAAYLAQTGVSLQEYLRMYDHSWDKLAKWSAHSFMSSKDDWDRTIWTTWSISYEAIRRRDEHTANLLLLWAHLDNKDLWYGLLQAYSRHGILPEVRAAIGNISTDQGRFLQSMNLLQSYSLAEASGNDSYSVHPVVHQWAFAQARISKHPLELLAICVCAAYAPLRGQRGYANEQRRIFAHTQACCQRLLAVRKNLKGEDKYVFGENLQLGLANEDLKENVLISVGQLASVYMSQYKLGKAGAMYGWMLKSVLEEPGQNYDLLMEIMTDIGTLFGAREDTRTKVEEILQWVLHQNCERLGSDHPFTIHSLYTLGCLYLHQNRLTQAEKVFLQAVDTVEKLAIPESVPVLRVIHWLGITYWRQNKLTEAREMLRLAFESLKRELEPEDMFVSRYICGTARFYHEQGELMEAEKIYGWALEGMEKTLGPEHPDVDHLREHLSSLREG